MPEDLHRTDLVLWAERQADGLRRLQRGERVNDLDWPHLIEEVEDLGASSVRAVRTRLLRALEHLIKAAAAPQSRHLRHWLHEAGTFLRDARLDWTPSMDRQLDVPLLYATALRNMRDLDHLQGGLGRVPSACPFTLPDLLPRDATDFAAPDALLTRLRA